MKQAAPAAPAKAEDLEAEELDETITIERERDGSTRVEIEDPTGLEVLALALVLAAGVAALAIRAKRRSGR